MSDIDKKSPDRSITMDKLVALCKSRGFVYPGSEIYGGLANAWDYGPLGVEMYSNIKKAWWKRFVQESEYNVGLDAAIIMNPRVWEATGHVGSFSDPLMDCKSCHERFRADKLIEEFAAAKGEDITADGWPNEKMVAYIAENGIVCPSCGKKDFTDIRQFNMMFKTHIGVTDDSSSVVYLRPETAQGIFANFKNVQRTSRKKIPFGIGQIGRAFRNEITPGNFIFRTREFDQMELEFFCEPDTDLEWFAYWKKFCVDWLKELGIKDEKMRVRDHAKEELSFYSKATSDIEILFPFGWSELWGIADRTDFDLNRHQEFSGQDLTYYDQDANRRYIPYVIEPSVGPARLMLAFLCQAYEEEVLGADENGKEDVRVVLHLHHALAPVKAAILPLSKKLAPNALELYHNLRKHFVCDYDEAGAIGRRYRRQDEAGTPFCVTFDFDSLEDKAVTIRERDSMTQVRIPIEEVKEWLEERLKY